MFKSRITVDNGNLQRRTQPSAGGRATTASAGRKSPDSLGGSKETANLSIGTFGGVQMNTMFRGIIPDNSGDDAALGTMLRDIWHYDNVGGSAVDLQCGLAFSDWTLIGIDPKLASYYNDSLAQLNMRVMLPQISRNYLIDGAFIGTLLWDKSSRTFQDVLIHDRFNATISPQPFFSVDPVVTVNSAANLQQFFNTYSPYADAMLKSYPRALLENFMKGSSVLDPVTTLMALRKGTQDSACVSYLRRLLPMYMLEKTLFRGTLTEASKRQRATTQISIGDDSWEPTTAEMQEYVEKFQMSEMDPLGAWVATRQGVTLSDVRPAGEMWKWTDTADVLVPYKLRALGISEAFLSSDGSYSNAEAALTMFLDNLETYRAYLTYKIFDSKLFPLIAVMNGLYKDKSSVKRGSQLNSLMFNLSNQKNLEVPKIQWHKNLTSPNASSLLDNLDKLSGKGFPVALKTWAAAANVDLGAALSDLEQDAEIRRQIAKVTGQPVAAPGTPSDGSRPSEDDTMEEAMVRAKNLEVYPASKPEFHKRKSLLDREFGEYKLSKTGKVVTASAREGRMDNDRIVKAVKALQDPHRFASVKKNVIERMGHMPRVGW